MILTQEIVEAAEVIKELTVDEARALPNMLGALAPVSLRTHGFYACTVGGVRHLFVRRYTASEAHR